MASMLTSRGRTTERLAGMLVLGLFVQVVCCVIAFEQAPRTDLGPGGIVVTGNETMMLIGILGFGLGGVLSLIAVIALGVLLGMRAHDDGAP